MSKEDYEVVCPKCLTKTKYDPERWVLCEGCSVWLKVSCEDSSGGEKE